jgi:hypothetical protein
MKHRNSILNKKTLLTLLAATVVSLSVRADLLVWDNFSAASSGSLSGTGSGTGWTGNWSGYGVNYATPGLTYPGLQTSGNAAVADGSYGTMFRSPGDLGGDGSDPIWMGVVMQGGAAGNGFGGLSLFTGGAENFFIGQGWAKSTYSIAVNGGNPILTSQSSGTLSFLVVELIFGTGTDPNTDNPYDTAYVWVDPTPGSTAPSTASAAITVTTIEDFDFDNVRISSGPGTFALGDLRIGQTYGDVAPVPEPTTLATLILGGLMLTAGSVRRFVSRRA